MRTIFQGLGVAILSWGLFIVLTITGPEALTAAYASCLPRERIDGRTAGMAVRQAERAGYADVQMEGKGCDNVWHGFGMKGGGETRIAVEPSGQVFPEGD
jgi:hypothetical protein